MIFATLAGWIIKAASSRWLRSVISTISGANDNAAQVAIAQIDSEIAARQSSRDIRLATAGFWEMRTIAALIAGCFTLHLTAVTLDTVFKFGWGIPAYPTPFDEWEGMILLSFFGVWAGFKALGTVAAIFLGGKK